MPFCSNKHSLSLLYSDPRVIIRIGDHEYELPKALLCEQSPYFRATFEGVFKEGQDQSVDLSEEGGVVSPRSFQMLVQWMTLGRVVFGELEPVEAITCTIEFVRIADMCQVTGMETLMAERIKAILLAPRTNSTRCATISVTNTENITPQHINSAALLPRGHPVRCMLASAAVKGYLLKDEHKFWKEAQGNADFAVDLLEQVKLTLNTLRLHKSTISVVDPLGREEFSLNLR